MLGIDMIQYKNSLAFVQFLNSLIVFHEECCNERPKKDVVFMFIMGMFDDVRMWICPFLI